MFGSPANLFISRCGFDGCHNRFSAVGETGCGCCKAILLEGLTFAGPPPAEGDQCGREPVISEGHRRVEANRQPWPALPMPARSISEQYRRAGPSRRQKASARAMQGFRAFQTAWRTIQGIETLSMIRKGQVKWLAKDDIPGQAAFVGHLFGLTHAA